MLDGVFVVLVDGRLSLDDIEGKFCSDAPFFYRLILIHGLAKRKYSYDDTEKCSQNISARIRPFLSGVVNIMFNELTSDIERIGV